LKKENNLLNLGLVVYGEKSEKLGPNFN
jgi:hypothetical protein